MGFSGKCLSASLRSYFTQKGAARTSFSSTLLPWKLLRYPSISHCHFLFAAQFLNFHLFRLPESSLSVQTFLSVFAGQLLLGGGLEEAGWRGYLLPCLYRNHHILISSAAVSVLWILWHLPYFFLPGAVQEGQNFISYAIIGLLTGFILTAIYLLTKSVLICMLFHSWQNTIVMVIPADTENTGFLLTFAALGLISALLCLFCKPEEHIYG